jgi:zinc transport system substrate-binding protein
MERWKIGLIALITILSVAAMYIITSATPPSSGGDKLTVAVTIMPQKEFVEAIAGDRAEVVVLVPPGADPHTYEPEPETLRKVSEARAYFIVGSGVEFENHYLNKIRSMNPGMRIINTSRGIELIPNQEEYHHAAESPYDPHVWTSPRNAMTMVNNTMKGLQEIDPHGSRYYQENAGLYIEKLRGLDSRIRKSLENRKGESVLVYHPAWGYFCRDYGLKQVAIEKEGKEPGPGTLSMIIREARRDGVRVILVSPQFSRKNADLIAREIGAEVVVVDPLGGNYTANIEAIAEALTR